MNNTAATAALIIVILAAIAIGYFYLGPQDLPDNEAPAEAGETGSTVLEPSLPDVSLGGKPPRKPGGPRGYTGNDTCRWANDGECDDPGIGTGACEQGTDYSDCWRIASGTEDNSCQWANDGECDEPHFGTGACAQATDRNDCGAVAYLRFRTDTCATAFNGVCEEPEGGNGACEARTDRADCVGRERPMEISDHFFGHDDRAIMDTSQMPWRVIGTLVDDNGGSCTATLIGDDILVTAAHCIEVEGGIDAEATFQSGFGRPGGALSARVTDYFLPPDRRSERQSSDEPSNTDWALLRIDAPMGRDLGFLEVRPLRNGRPEHAVGTSLYQAGYSWDTGDNLSGNLDCEILALEDENKLSHNCDTTTGDSGSPFMIREGDDYFVVGVDSTFRIQPNTPAQNIATGSNGWLPFLEDFRAGTIGANSASGGGKPRK